MARKSYSNKKKQKKRYSLVSTIVFIVILLLIALAYYIVTHYYGQGNNGNVVKERSAPPSIVYGDGGTGDLKIHFIDVGQADGIVIQFPNGKNMLVDSSDRDNAQINKLTDYIDSLGITKFDFLLATHAHADHIGGLPKIFEKYQVDYVFRPYTLSSYSKANETFPEGFNQGPQKSGYTQSSKNYYEVLKCIMDEGSDWSFFNKDSDMIMCYSEDGVEYNCTFDFLTPTSDVADINYSSNMNNYSPIIKVDYCGFDVMLTGDAEKTVEDEFLNYYSSSISDYDVDLLKVGHHGSDTSSSIGFLNAIKPEYAVISCGTDNKYHHPIASTLEKFVGSGTEIFRTDVQGNIVLTVHKDGTFSITTSIEDYNESDLFVPGA